MSTLKRAVQQTPPVSNTTPPHVRAERLLRASSEDIERAIQRAELLRRLNLARRQVTAYELYSTQHLAELEAAVRSCENAIMNFEGAL
jgi:hypothetical protein